MLSILLNKFYKLLWNKEYRIDIDINIKINTNIDIIDIQLICLLVLP
jgi:hypothetical protein